MITTMKDSEQVKKLILLSYKNWAYAQSLLHYIFTIFQSTQSNCDMEHYNKKYNKKKERSKVFFFYLTNYYYIFTMKIRKEVVMSKKLEMEKSKHFYMRITGDYALWADPATKGGGERISYQVPTAQAIQGICDAVYFKPTIRNVVDAIKVVNPVRFHSMGYRALYGDLSAGLNYVTVLENVEYLVQYHFEWNLYRQDLSRDRIMKKHETITERSLRKGGRRDVFLGAREFLGYVEQITEQEYLTEKTFYYGSDFDLGNIFHSFIYSNDETEPLKSLFTHTIMRDGIIQIKPQEECEITNILSSYTIKAHKGVVSVDEELKEYGEGGESI